MLPPFSSRVAASRKVQPPGIPGASRRSTHCIYSRTEIGEIGRGSLDLRGQPSADGGLLFPGVAIANPRFGPLPEKRDANERRYTKPRNHDAPSTMRAALRFTQDLKVPQPCDTPGSRCRDGLARFPLFPPARRERSCIE